MCECTPWKRCRGCIERDKRRRPKTEAERMIDIFEMGYSAEKAIKRNKF